jgi:hypothetical protein
MFATLIKDRSMSQRMVLDGNGEFVTSLIQAAIAAIGRHPNKADWLLQPTIFYDTIAYYCQQQLASHLELSMSAAKGAASSCFRLMGVHR